MEVCGIPPPEVLAKGQRKTKFFNESNMPKLVPNSHGKVRKPGTKVLDDILECSDQSFVNFVEVSRLIAYRDRSSKCLTECRFLLLPALPRVGP